MLFLCLLTVIVAAPAPAYAHGLLVVSTPANGATVTEPPEAVSLAFTEKPPQFAFFSITAPNGLRVEQPWSHAEPFPLDKPVREYQIVDGIWQPMEFKTGFPVRVPVAHWPEHGQYVVRYQSVATDGEEVKGEVKFTYRGSVVPPPAGWQAPASEPSAELVAAVGQVRTGEQQARPATPAPAQALTPAAAEPAAPPADGRGPWPWLVPLLLVLAAAGLFVLWRTGPGRAKAGSGGTKPGAKSGPRGPKPGAKAGPAGPKAGAKAGQAGRKGRR